MPMEIRFEQVEKWFGKKNVLHNLDWTLHPGDTWRIEGPSGVGKTTLLRLMMGLEHPTRGTIQGTDALRFAPVFQENRLRGDEHGFLPPQKGNVGHRPAIGAGEPSSARRGDYAAKGSSPFRGACFCRYKKTPLRAAGTL